MTEYLKAFKLDAFLMSLKDNIKQRKDMIDNERSTS